MSSCEQEQDSVGMRDRVYAGCGFACLLVALNMLLWGGLPWTQVLGVSLLDTLQYKTVSQNAGMALGMGLLALVARRKSIPRVFCLGLTGFTIAAADLFVFLYCIGVNDICTPPVIVATSACIGISSGAVFYLWGLVLGRLHERESARTVLYSIMASALCLIATNSLAHAFQWALFTAVAVLSAVFYGMLAKQLEKQDDKGRQTKAREGIVPVSEAGRRTKNMSADAVFWPVLFCMAAIVFALVVMRMAVLVGLDRKSDLNIAGGICLFFLAAILLVYWFGLPGSEGGSRRIDTVACM